MAVSSIKLDFPNPFGSALALSFSTDGKTLIAGCSKGSVIIYNTGDGSVVRKAVETGYSPNSIAISPDKSMASAAEDYSIVMWKIK